jgi:enoyl-CoA hydratase/carnithine racemase
MDFQQSAAALSIIKTQINRGSKVDRATAVTLVEGWTKQGVTAGFITSDAQERLRAFRARKNNRAFPGRRG